MKTLKDQLKKARTQVRAFAVVPAKPTPPPEPEPDFKALFKDVKPLKQHGRVSHPAPRPSAKPRHGNRHTALTDAVEEALLEKMLGWFEPAEIEHQHARPGMPHHTLKRLRNGHWPVVAELDLHGLDRYQAQERIAIFIHRARSLGKCVRIVHGKGFGSNGAPVLKRAVRTWLKHHPDVLAYCEAQEHSGGSGALLVLLKSASTQ